MITEADVKQVVKRLRAIYNPGQPEDEQVQAWWWAMKKRAADLDRSDLIAAAEEIVESEARFMPRPGTLLGPALRRAVKRKGSAPFQGTEHDPALECRVCGAKLTELQPEDMTMGGLYEPTRPALGILHNAKIHEQLGEPMIGGYYR